MNTESSSLAQSFYNVTKLVAAAVLLLFLGFSSTASAAYTCSQLFEQDGLSYQNYNPSAPKSLASFLEKPGVLDSLKEKIRKDKNLDLLKDHVIFFKNTLLEVIAETDSRKISKTAESKIKEIDQRIVDQKITFFWLWKIALMTTLIKQNFDEFKAGEKVNVNYITTNSKVDKLINLINFTWKPTRLQRSQKDERHIEDWPEVARYADAAPLFTFLRSLAEMNISTEMLELALVQPDRSDIFIMGVNLQPFSDFLDLENSHLSLGANALSDFGYDGKDVEARKKEGRIAIADHDASHMIREIDDRLSAGPLWPAIHTKIHEKIKELTGLKRVCTEFIYWNLLHERYFRKQIVTAVLEKKSNNVFNSMVLDLNTDTQRPIRDVIIDELKDKDYFGQDFKNFFNVTSIYDIGSKAMQKIFMEVSGETP